MPPNNQSQKDPTYNYKIRTALDWVDPEAFLENNAFKMYTDGSFGHTYMRKSSSAGWGFCAFDFDTGILEDLAVCKKSGSVYTSQNSLQYLGAERATNNTGKITAVIEAMTWILDIVQKGGDQAEKFRNG